MGHVAHNIESLEGRRLFAITASFADGVLTVNGDDAANEIAVGRNAGGQLFVNDGDVTITGGAPTLANTTAIVINGLGENDLLSIDQTGGPITIPTTINGGDGNDEMTGGDGVDRMFGGAGNDGFDGNRGNDQFFGQAGDDFFIWDPGEGSDLVEGGSGDADRLVFNGNDNPEVFKVVDNGSRVTLTRNVGNIVMDVDDVESFLVDAAGGADSLTVEDLGGTDLREVDLNLGPQASLVPGVGDAAPDEVTLIGDNDNDRVTVDDDGEGGVIVEGFHARVSITRAEGTQDRLTLIGGGGDDTLDASGLPAGLFGIVVLEGNAGDDTLLGSGGVDGISGGGGNDLADGNQAPDSFEGGGGTDEFIWDPGDGSDFVDGGAGNDTLRFNGSNQAEVFAATRIDTRVLFTRNLGNIVMDNTSVERIVLNARGGADSLTVNDLAGTGVRNVDVDLGEPVGSGTADGAADAIVVNGTDGDDRIVVRSGPGNSVNVSGLAAKVNVVGVDGTLDTLRVNGQGANDDIIASTVSAGALALLHLDGGSGNDDLFGGAGNDLLDGGNDTDFLDGNGGTDTALNGETFEDIP